MSKAKMQAPEGVTSVSFAGVSYDVEDGVVEVPAQAVEALTSHGLVALPHVEEVKAVKRNNKEQAS
jgi:hypothetical protein